MRQALSFLPPKRCSRSDVFDRHDLRSLLGLLLASGEAATAMLRGGLGRLIQPSQLHDYVATELEGAVDVERLVAEAALRAVSEETAG